MAVLFSSIVAAQERGSSRSSFSAQALDLAPLGDLKSSVLVCDDFRVSGRPFPLHPHAGFVAATYVFPDSAGRLRSRDSFGNDIVVGAGGLVWTHAGSGIVHHETPADTGELHGLQLFVNLTSPNKSSAPKTMTLSGSEVPEWTNAAGDRVRVVVGCYEHLTSPMVPIEPFTLLDVELRRHLTFDHPQGHVTLIYVATGDLAVSSEGGARHLAQRQAIAMHGDGARLSFAADELAHLVVMSAPEIREPVLIDGPFIMSSAEQIAAARVRYRSGGMGQLPPS